MTSVASAVSVPGASAEKVLSGFVRPRHRLLQAPSYDFFLDPVWVSDETYSSEQWFRSSWNWLNEVVFLIERHFGHRWTKNEFMRRFGIPIEDGEVRLPGGRGHWRQDVLVLRILNEKDLSCGPLCLDDFNNPDWEDSNTVHYVSVGWVRDIFWAMHMGFTRAHRDSNGRKIAVREGSSDRFEMTNCASNRTLV